jgi:protease-4
MLDEIHQQFIEAVKNGRGDALRDDDKNIFSGLFWTGARAKELGLVDEFGSAGYVAREVIKAEEIVDFTYRENLIDRFAERIGAAMARTMTSVLSDATRIR